MSTLLNAADRMFVWANDVNYIVRGFLRNDGEVLKLPKAVPDNRKMDYMFRDFFMVFVTTYMTELSVRSIEQFYVVPHFLKDIQLDKLSELYKPGGLHTPDFVQQMKQVPNFTREFPRVLRGHMLGNMNSPGAYYAIPTLMEHQDIKVMETALKQLQDKKAPALEIQQAEQRLLQTKLLRHHIQRIVDPETYLETFLKPQLSATGKLTGEDISLLKNQLKNLDKLQELFEKARAPINAGDAYKLVRSQHRKTAFAHLTQPEFEIAFRRPFPLTDIPKLFFKKGPVKGIQTYLKLNQLAQDPFMATLKNTPSKATQELFALVQDYATHPDVSSSSLIKHLAAAKTPKLLQERLKGPAPSVALERVNALGLQKGLLRYFDLSRRFSPDGIAEALRNEILLPLAKTELHGKPIVETLLHDLSMSKVIQKRLNIIFKGSEFWLKLPISILSLFLVYGLVANKFDIGFLQPLQRKIVKERGDSREFLAPGFLGTIPGIATFAVLMKTPFIQRLGYVGSFGVSGLAALTAFATSTALMFKTRLAQPRQASTLLTNPAKTSVLPNTLPTSLASAVAPASIKFQA